MKSSYSLALIAVAGTMLTTSTTYARTEGPDKSINNEIFDLLLANNSLATNSMKFAVLDGVVTITGTTSSLGNKAQTDNVIAKLPGVLRVDDKRPANDDDTSLTDEVKSSLMFHNSTSNTITRITTANGVVTITGIATSEAEKNRTTQLAAAIKGVTGVINNMTVAAN